jgi:transcriptional regulator with XRE-family HTH domain
MSRPGAYGKARIPAVPRTLGERLRKVRLAWDWSQTAMAEALGTNQRTYSAWERDGQFPSQASMMALCRFLRLQSVALLQGRGFTVPEVPLRLGPETGSEGRQGTLIVVPDLDPGAAAMLLHTDPDEPSKPLGPRQAVAALKDALKEGRPVWMVVGPPES